MSDVLHLPSLSGCTFSLFSVGNKGMGIGGYAIKTIFDRKRLESISILKFNFQTSDNDPLHPSARRVMRPAFDAIRT